MNITNTINEAAKHPIVIDESVGALIKQARVRAGLSQKALGENVGLTFQQIQKYESGKNRVSASVLFFIANALKKPVAYFFSRAEQALISVGVISEEAMLADNAEGGGYIDEKMVVQYFSQIGDQHVRDSLVSLMKSLAQG